MDQRRPRRHAASTPSRYSGVPDAQRTSRRRTDRLEAGSAICDSPWPLVKGLGGGAVQPLYSEFAPSIANIAVCSLAQCVAFMGPRQRPGTYHRALSLNVNGLNIQRPTLIDSDSLIENSSPRLRLPSHPRHRPIIQQTRLGAAPPLVPAFRLILNIRQKSERRDSRAHSNAPRLSQRVQLLARFAPAGVRRAWLEDERGWSRGTHGKTEWRFGS